MRVSKKVVHRLQTGLKKWRRLLKTQQDRDVSEADTVTLVKDILAQVFGYDKFAEVTSEHEIKGTYCDVAVKIKGTLRLLIEVKAIGLQLKEHHVKQAIDYAANEGVDWVVLTNGITWTLYHVLFKKPIDKEEIAVIDLLDCSVRSQDDVEKLYLLTKEGLLKGAPSEYREKMDATSRFMLAAILLNSPLALGSIRKEVRRVNGILVDNGAIEKVLRDQVIKREAQEGESARKATKRYLSKAKKRAKAKAKRRKATAQQAEAL